MQATVSLQPGLVEGGKPSEVEKQMAIQACLDRITPDNFQQVLADIIAIGYVTAEIETCPVDQVQLHIPSLLFCLPFAISADANTADVDILDAHIPDATCRLRCLMLNPASFCKCTLSSC